MLQYYVKYQNFIIQKYFNFQKMDKKNVQKKLTQIFYAKSLDCEHF